MKVYVLTDLEGVAGVVRWDHCSTDGRYYQRSKRLLCAEVNAAVEGALEAGATEIIVWDGHGSGGLEPEWLHPEAKLLFGRGAPKALGLDDSFDAMFVIGQHAMNLTEQANLCHSYSSRGIYRMTLNGVEIGELGMRAILAGYFDIPTVLVTGDDKVCLEAQAILPHSERVAVKISTGRQSALCLHPSKAREAIKAGAQRALETLDQQEPYFFEGPYEFIVEPYDPRFTPDKDRSFDRPVGEPKIQRADDFLEISR
jgi:D-amino peptidase